MLLVTDKGLYYTVVEDFKNPARLWARSQDKDSIEDLREWLKGYRNQDVEVSDEPTWDYQYRIAVTRREWADYLGQLTEDLSAHKLKPAVARARGHEHPVSRMVESVFYYMSEHRPDGSKPAWLGGGWKR